MEDKKYIKALYDELSPTLDLGDYTKFEQSLATDEVFRKSIFDEASGVLDLGDYATFSDQVKKKEYAKAILGGETPLEAVGLKSKEFTTPKLPYQSPEVSYEDTLPEVITPTGVMKSNVSKGKFLEQKQTELSDKLASDFEKESKKLKSDYEKKLTQEGANKKQLEEEYKVRVDDLRLRKEKEASNEWDKLLDTDNYEYLAPEDVKGLNKEIDAILSKPMPFDKREEALAGIRDSFMTKVSILPADIQNTLKREINEVFAKKTLFDEKGDVTPYGWKKEASHKLNEVKGAENRILNEWKQKYPDYYEQVTPTPSGGVIQGFSPSADADPAKRQQFYSDYIQYKKDLTLLGVAEEKLGNIMQTSEGKGTFADAFRMGGRDLLAAVSSIGWSDVVKAIENNIISTKVQKGEKLSEGEQAVFDTYGIFDAVQQGMEGRGYKLGNVFAQSLPMMESIASLNIMGVLGGAGMATIKQIAKKEGVKKLLTKEGAKLIGKEAGKLSGAMVKGAPLTPMSWVRQQTGLAGQKVLNEKGEWTIDKATIEGKVEATLKGLATGGTELGSEILGGYMGEFGQVLRSIPGLKNIKLPKVVGQMAKTAGMQGAPTEIAEEFVNMLWQAPIGDQPLSEIGLQDIWDTIWTTAGLTTILGSAAIPGGVMSSVHRGRNYDVIKIFGKDAVAQVRDAIAEKDMSKLGESIKSAFEGKTIEDLGMDVETAQKRLLSYAKSIATEVVVKDNAPIEEKTQETGETFTVPQVGAESLVFNTKQEFFDWLDQNGEEKLPSPNEVGYLDNNVYRAMDEWKINNSERLAQEAMAEEERRAKELETKRLEEETKDAERIRRETEETSEQAQGVVEGEEGGLRVGDIEEHGVETVTGEEVKIYHTTDEIENKPSFGVEDPHVGFVKDGAGTGYRGKKLEQSEIPDNLYHVTTNLNAVNKSGKLVAGEKGGLGGGQMKGVSFTVDKNIADRMVNVMRQAIRFMNATTETDAKQILREIVAEDNASAGINLDVESQIKYFDTRRGLKESLDDTKDMVLKSYLNDAERASDKLINPILFGVINLKGKNVDDVGVVEVNKSAIPKDAAVVEGTDKFLNEIRVLSEVPKEVISAPIEEKPPEVPPPVEEPPKVAETTPKEEREKRLLARFKNALKLSDKFKELVDRKGSTYTVVPNDVTSEEVDFLIASNGIGKSEDMVKDTQNSLPPRVRGLMGIRVITAMDAMADASEEEKDYKAEADYRLRAVKMAEYLDDSARDWGRGIQIFASTEVNSALAPKSQVIKAKKAVRKQRDKMLQDSKKDVDGKNGVMQKANEESINDLIDSKLYEALKKRVAELEDKLAQKEETKPPKAIPKDKVAIVKADIAKQWDIFKKAGKEGLSATVVGLNAKQIEAIGNIVADYVKLGIYKTEDIIKRLQKDWLKNTKTILSDEDARKLLPDKIGDKTLADIEKEGIIEDSAEKLAQRIDRMLKDSKTAKDDPIKQMINTLFEKVKEKDTKEEVPTEKKSAIDKIREALIKKELYAGVWEEAKEKVLFDIETNQELSEDQKSEYNRRIADFYDEVIGKPFSEKQTEQAVKEEIKELGINIDEVIRDHYTVYDATKKTLQEKLVEKLGLSEESAKMFTEAIGKEFDKIAVKKKRAALERGIKPKERVSPKKAKQVWEKLIELTNLGAFSDAEFAEAYADAWGFPKLTPEQIKEIERLSKLVYEAPEGFQKYEKVQDLLVYQSKIPGIDLGEIAMGMWYVSILSGYRTQFKNIFANTLNTLFELVTIGIKDPRNMPTAINGLFNGYIRGGYAFTHILRRGYNPIRGFKLEVPQALEQYKFKGGGWNPLNWFRYVPRFMVAADAFSFAGLKEMRAYEMAMNEARLENRKADVPSKSNSAKANEILNKSKERLAIAEEQATQEGLSDTASTKEERNTYKRRVWEIMEQGRKQNIIEDSAHFAAHGTFNFPPEGLIGFATEMIGEMTQNVAVRVKVVGKQWTVRPLKFIIPFTRIIANVANTALDYFPPTGLARGLSGGIGVKYISEHARFGQNTYREYTQEERKTVYRKMMIGLGATIATFLFSEPPDDDEESNFEITANGYGNYQKNYQLMESGWQKYSIRIGKKWYSYQYTPLVLALAPIGFFRDEQKYNKERFDEKEAWKNLGMSYFKSFTVLGDMTWVTQLTGLLDALKGNTLSEVESYFSRLGQSFGKSIAYPKLAEQTVQLIDYISENPRRAASSLYGKITKDIPIVRNKYNVMLNAVGKPVMYDPFQLVSEIKSDPFWDFVNDKGIQINKPNQKDNIYDDILKVERQMTDDEYYNFVFTSGPEIERRILTEVMPKTMNDEDAKKEADKIETAVKKQTKIEMFGWGDFRMANPEEWKILKDNGAIQIPHGSIEDVRIDDKTVYTFTEGDLQEINKNAMNYYAGEMIKFLKTEEGRKSKTKVVLTTTGAEMAFDMYKDQLWAATFSTAKGERLKKQTKK